MVRVGKKWKTQVIFFIKFLLGIRLIRADSQNRHVQFREMLTSIPQAHRLFLSAGSSGFGIKEQENLFPSKGGKGNFFVVLV